MESLFNWIEGNREIIIVLLWLLYSNWEGLREARYWYYKNQNNRNSVIITPDDHNHFGIQRTITVMGFTMAFGSLWFIVISILLFSFVHNGSYYHHRNKLQPNLYRKKWFDQSTTSTALLTKFLTPKVRTVCFIIGVILTILYKVL